MFAIINCACGKKRIIDMTDKVTKCPWCGKSMETKKAAFMETIVPQWVSMAKENGKLLDY